MQLKLLAEKTQEPAWLLVSRASPPYTKSTLRRGDCSRDYTATLSILDIGPVIFGTTDNLVNYLQQITTSRQPDLHKLRCSHEPSPDKRLIFLMAGSFAAAPAKLPNHCMYMYCSLSWPRPFIETYCNVVKC